MLSINTVTLEGPDLSGKTTLYNSLHRKTNFCWDIRDRGSLSRVCFAKLYNRNEEQERSRLTRDLSCLNNRVIVLLPSLNVLLSRYEKRGDEIQTRDSLVSLYEIYCEEAKKIENLPSVLVLKDLVCFDDIVEKSAQFLKDSEYVDFTEIGQSLSSFLKNSSCDEHTVDIMLQGKLSNPKDTRILQNPLEGDYYRNILWDFENVIRKEMRGLNPYGKSQGYDSRRFYYNSDSCISSIHLMPRGSHLKCLAVFRSTNVEVNASIDIEFLNFLVKSLGSKYFLDCETYDVRLRINSAHLINSGQENYEKEK